MLEFKLIVAGGRDYTKYDRVYSAIMELAEGELADKAVSIVSGMAKGADKLGYIFALSNNVKVYEFPANWNQFGKSAGFIRNTAMANFSDGLLAFWDGQSKGTAHMISTMKAQKKPVFICRY